MPTILRRSAHLFVCGALVPIFPPYFASFSLPKETLFESSSFSGEKLPLSLLPLITSFSQFHCYWIGRSLLREIDDDISRLIANKEQSCKFVYFANVGEKKAKKSPGTDSCPGDF